MNLISALYGIERDLKFCGEVDRKIGRYELSQPVLAQLKSWIEKTQPQVTAQNALGKAISYLASNWSKLERHGDAGYLSLDNKTAEPAIRPSVIVRKDWLFSDTLKGATASAQICSLVDTQRREPYA